MFNVSKLWRFCFRKYHCSWFGFQINSKLNCQATSDHFWDAGSPSSPNSVSASYIPGLANSILIRWISPIDTGLGPNNTVQPILNYSLYARVLPNTQIVCQYRGLSLYHACGGLISGAGYTFAVVAFNDAGESTPSFVFKISLGTVVFSQMDEKVLSILPIPLGWPRTVSPHHTGWISAFAIFFSTRVELLILQKLFFLYHQNMNSIDWLLQDFLLHHLPSLLWWLKRLPSIFHGLNPLTRDLQMKQSQLPIIYW